MAAFLSRLKVKLRKVTRVPSSVAFSLLGIALFVFMTFGGQGHSGMDRNPASLDKYGVQTITLHKKKPQATDDSWRESPFLTGNEAILDGRPPNSGSIYGYMQEKTFAVIHPCRSHEPDCFKPINVHTQSCLGGHKNCRQVADPSKADVVVFYVYTMIREDLIPAFERPMGQIWVMYNMEPPNSNGNFGLLDFPRIRGKFNWTLSYYLDADIPLLPGKLTRLPASRDKDYDAIYRGKSVTAAWFANICHDGSKRGVYISNMQEFGGLDLHIFGRCGNHTCQPPKQGQEPDVNACLSLLSKKYFFYLAFENAMCKDYVSDKFFKIFKDVDAIPVVRGGTDYHRYFPPDTFVDASDFERPGDLALYLKALAKDKERYVYMLGQKNKWAYDQDRPWYCKLCDKMHDTSPLQFYPDMRKWYVKDQCLLVTPPPRGVTPIDPEPAKTGTT